MITTEVGKPYPEDFKIAVRGIAVRNEPVTATYAEVYLSGLSTAQVYMDSIEDEEMKAKWDKALADIKEVVTYQLHAELVKEFGKNA